MFKRIYSITLILIIVAVIFGFFYWQWANQPVNSQDFNQQTFVIPQGQSASAIGHRLKEMGLIKSNLAFQLLVNRKDYDLQLQAGDFYLSKSMDLTTVIESLTHGSLDYWITFPEGLRVEEYAERLAEKSAQFNSQEFILAAKTHEGRLFPDTYLIPQTASAQVIVDLLVNTFDQKSPTQDDQLIILASLIEREAKHDKDRALISSVLHNRLRINMALQIDATLQYIKGNHSDWWPIPLAKDKLLNSPFNTYQHPGLPPKPIANPGLASLKAAMNPVKTEYLYYVSDSNGNNHYAEDLEGHQANIAKYLNK